MIARAACAALGIVAGALASTSASAQPLPDAPPPAKAAPPAGPLAPAATPWPLIFRDGSWRPFGGFVEIPPPPPTGRDPLYATGITLGIGGLLTTALGVGLLVQAGSSMKICGLSGCIALPDRESQNYAAALLAGGVTGTIFGGTTAYFGAKGPASPRTSSGRTVAGVALSTIGFSLAASGLINALTPYTDHAAIHGEVFPLNDYAQSPHPAGASVMFTLVSAAFLAVGLPLWVTGAKAPFRPDSARDAANRLDFIPSAGGAALRWTR
ncbi:MAG: hypothetical protein ABJE95_30100 [Byssovorax sp.]